MLECIDDARLGRSPHVGRKVGGGDLDCATKALCARVLGGQWSPVTSLSENQHKHMPVRCVGLHITCSDLRSDRAGGQEGARPPSRTTPGIQFYITRQIRHEVAGRKGGSFPEGPRLGPHRQLFRHLTFPIFGRLTYGISDSGTADIWHLGIGAESNPSVTCTATRCCVAFLQLARGRRAPSCRRPFYLLRQNR